MSRIQRRRFLLAAGVTLATPVVAIAQQAGRMRRIGVLSAPTLATAYIESLRQGLRDHGYVEGQNMHIYWRIADGNDEKLPKFAAELLAQKVDVIVAVAGSGAIAAKMATKTVPVVFVLVPDPVAYGLVRTLGRPDGNLTGLTALQTELMGKGMELLKQALPSLKAVAILSNAENPGANMYLQASRASAAMLSLDVRVVETRNSSELVSALTDIASARAQAVVIAPDPLLFSYRVQIIEFATNARLPVLGWQPQVAESGALISYGANQISMFRRVGYFVDKILKGAKPADLPVEQPTEFDLIVNLKTAKILGIKIPQSLLIRANRVIE